MKDTIQDQLIAARRTQILEAARRVFAQKGFHSTTIRDISKEAGIGDGTIYNYFENKTSLLLGIFELMQKSVQEDQDLARLNELDLRGFIRIYLAQPLMIFQADNFELFRVVISEIMVNQELRDLYYQKILEPTLALPEAFFQKWATQEGLEPARLKLLLHTIASLITGLIVQRIIGDQTLQDHWEELPDLLTGLILEGFNPQK